MKKNFYIFLIIFLAGGKLFPQDIYSGGDTLRSYGFGAEYLVASHSADFREFEGVPTCCPRFGSGDGIGILIKGYMELPLPYRLKMGMRASWMTMSGTLGNDIPDTASVRVGDQIVIGEFNHVLDHFISDIAVEPYLRFRAFKGLHFSAGWRVGLITSGNYEYVEKLDKPENTGVFADTDSRERNASEGEIPELSTVYSALVFGASYALPLNEENSWQIMPNINYRLGRTDMINDKEWKINYFSFGISLRYTPLPEIKEPEEIFRMEKYIDTVEIETIEIAERLLKPGTTVVDTLRSLKRDTVIITEVITRTDTLFVRPKPVAKVTFNADTVKITKQWVTESFPMLHTIFFERDSSNISGSYNLLHNPIDFEISEIEPHPLKYHRETLNIIGSRMLQNTSARLEIRGIADSTTEGGDCGLAKSRAESVRQYLSEVWNIPESRLRLTSHSGYCGPEFPTVTPNDSGFAENRRVEFESTDPEILSSIEMGRILRIKNIDPAEIIIDPAGTTPKGIAENTLILKQNSGELLREENTGQPGRKTIEIQKSLVDNLRDASNLTAELYIEDTESQTAMDSESAFIAIDTSDINIQRMSLVLFNVGSDVISSIEQRSIRRFMRSAGENAKIRITGYTDALGSPEQNLELSRRRAENTAKIIKRYYPRIDILSVDGVASGRYPPGITSYADPISRFLARTVQIEVLENGE